MFCVDDFARIDCQGSSLILSESSLEPRLDSQSSILASSDCQLTFAQYCNNLLKALEKSCVQVVTGLGFPFHWLINWCKIF